MIPPSLDQLRAGLASPEATAALVAARPGSGQGRRAAVLALLSHAGRDEPGPASGLRIVLIEKTGHLRNHAGQVAFPGGRIEAGETVVQAALREASEEVGIVGEDVEVLGCLPSARVPASGFNVHTVVGWWHRPVSLQPVDVGEIAAVHLLSVSHLIDPANRVTFTLPSGHQGPTFVVDGLFIWGLTGYLLSGLLDLAGWTQPWDAGRLCEVPPRFLRR